MSNTARPYEQIKSMHDDYLEGGTLRAIGRKHDLSHERVRQLFEQHGFKPRLVRIDSVKRYERTLEAWEQEDAIIDAYKRNGNVGDVVDELGVSRADAEEVLHSFDHRSSYRSRGGGGCPRRYTNDQIEQFLRIAAIGKPLTVAAYQTLRAKGRSVSRFTAPIPTALTIIKRYGTWKLACDAAGVAANPSRTSKAGFTPDRCIESVRACAMDMGNVPSYMEYSQWSKKSGAKDTPSGATVRYRCGGWSNAIDKVRHDLESEWLS